MADGGHGEAGERVDGGDEMTATDEAGERIDGGDGERRGRRVAQGGRERRGDGVMRGECGSSDSDAGWE